MTPDVVIAGAALLLVAIGVLALIVRGAMDVDSADRR